MAFKLKQMKQLMTERKRTYKKPIFQTERKVIHK